MSRRIHPRKQLGYSARQTTQDRWQFRVANGTSLPECKTFPDFETGRLWAEQQVRLHQDGELASHKQAREFTLVQALS
ncbi:MAG: hypothetical protein KGL58_07510 [Pseudomonadota bacterium]|nr:hypothetical protein [Pseudomonadota bacterium]